MTDKLPEGLPSISGIIGMEGCVRLTAYLGNVALIFNVDLAGLKGIGWATDPVHGLVILAYFHSGETKVIPPSGKEGIID